MSLSLYPYRIDSNQLSAAVGSRDASLVDQIKDDFEEDIEEINEAVEDEIEDGAPSVEHALTHLIMGAPQQSDAEGVYLYAAELLIKKFGTPLDGEYMGFFDAATEAKVDQLLSKVQIPLRMSDVYRGEAPLGLAAASEDDFPTVSTFAGERLASLADAFTHGQTKSADHLADVAPNDREFLDNVLRDLSHWFIETNRHSGSTLVIFGY